MLHELWNDSEDDGAWWFLLSGPMGDGARSLLSPSARIVWTVEAVSHFDAVTKCYEHQGWGEYTTDFPEIDKETYASRGLE